MFIVTQLVIAKCQPNCPSADEQVNKMLYIHTEYWECSMDTCLTWINLETVMLNDHLLHDSIHEMSRISQAMETE